MTLSQGQSLGSSRKVLVSFASAIGATLHFSHPAAAADWVQPDSASHAAVNAGVAKEGAFYLFALRLVPLFPFFLVNC